MPTTRSPLPLQWLKAYFDQHTCGRGLVHEYDPAGRRALCKTGDHKASAGAGGSRPAPAPMLPPPAAAAPAGRLTAGAAPAASPALAASAPPKRAGSGKTLSSVSSGGLRASGGSLAGRSRGGGGSDDGLAEQLQAEAATWRAAADTATKEKDFYVSGGGPGHWGDRCTAGWLI